MSTLTKNMRPQLFDREKVFRYYWVDLGDARSIGKTIKWMESIGLVNPKNSKPFTPMGVWFALWRWAIDNVDKSLEIRNEAGKGSGEFFTRDEWVKFLNEKSVTACRYVPRVRMKWQKANGMMTEE